MTDWSGVPFNAAGCPLGYVKVTPSMMPGVPVYVDAAGITILSEEGPNTAIVTNAGRLVVKENIQEVFRRKAEANTVEVIVKPPAPPSQIRKKA